MFNLISIPNTCLKKYFSNNLGKISIVSATVTLLAASLLAIHFANIHLSLVSPEIFGVSLCLFASSLIDTCVFMEKRSRYTIQKKVALPPLVTPFVTTSSADPTHSILRVPIAPSTSVPISRSLVAISIDKLPQMKGKDGSFLDYVNELEWNKKELMNWIEKLRKEDPSWLFPIDGEKINFDEPRKQDGNTLLHLAIEQAQYLNIMFLIFHFGADGNIPNKKGQTVIDLLENYVMYPTLPKATLNWLQILLLQLKIVRKTPSSINNLAVLLLPKYYENVPNISLNLRALIANLELSTSQSTQPVGEKRRVFYTQTSARTKNYSSLQMAIQAHDWDQVVWELQNASSEQLQHIDSEGNTALDLMAGKGNIDALICMIAYGIPFNKLRM